MINNIKSHLFGFIIGIILASSIGLTVAYQISANQISYQDTNVANAITDLYNLSETYCPNKYRCFIKPSITDQGEAGLSEEDILTYIIGNQTENFRIAYIDNDIIKLLPEYNIKPTGTIRQSSSTSKIAFSSSAYWSSIEGSGNYTEPYPYVYSGSGTRAEYSTSNNVYGIVEAYKQNLKNAGISVIEARLLTYDELYELIETKNYAWAYDSTYWIGSARKENLLYYVHENSGIRVDSYTSVNGVRPVIIIPRSSI